MLNNSKRFRRSHWICIQELLAEGEGIYEQAYTEHLLLEGWKYGSTAISLCSAQLHTEMVEFHNRSFHLSVKSMAVSK